MGRRYCADVVPVLLAAWLWGYLAVGATAMAALLYTMTDSGTLGAWCTGGIGGHGINSRYCLQPSGEADVTQFRLLISRFVNEPPLIGR